MPRRHGWLHDFHQELDHGQERAIPVNNGYNQPQQPSPVTVNVNINLGDIISQLVKGQKTTKEALEEIIQESHSRKRLLLEDED